MMKISLVFTKHVQLLFQASASAAASHLVLVRLIHRPCTWFLLLWRQIYECSSVCAGDRERGLIITANMSAQRQERIMESVSGTSSTGI